MADYRDFGDPQAYPSLTQTRSIVLAIQDALNTSGVASTADWLIATYAEDAPMFAVASRVVLPGDFTINPQATFVPMGESFELFAHVVDKLNIEVWKNGDPVALAMPHEGMGGDPSEFVEAIQTGTTGSFENFYKTAYQSYQPVWLRYVWLLQIHLLMDYGITREQAIERLKLAEEGIPVDGYTVVQAGLPPM